MVQKSKQHRNGVRTDDRSATEGHDMYGKVFWVMNELRELFGRCVCASAVVVTASRQG